MLNSFARRDSRAALLAGPVNLMLAWVDGSAASERRLILVEASTALSAKHPAVNRRSSPPYGVNRCTG
jgi:hypothetical protein